MIIMILFLRGICRIFGLGFGHVLAYFLNSKLSISDLTADTRGIGNDVEDGTWLKKRV